MKTETTPILLNLMWENPDKVTHCCQCGELLPETEVKGQYIRIANIIVSLVCALCSNNIVRMIRRERDLPE